MKEFFLTSTLPYWLLLILSLSGTLGALWITYKTANSEDETDNKPIAKKTMLTFSAIMLASALFVIILYFTLGNGMMWWATDSELSFWSALFRVFLLLLFLVAQAAAPFVYKFFMDAYYGTDTLSVKSQFISLVVIVPVALVISLIVGSPTWFYVICGVGIVGAAVYSLVNNSKTAGLSDGAIYTVVSFILCAATLVALFLFIVSLITLLTKVLPLIGMGVGLAVVFSKTYGNAVLQRDNAGNYIANDGSKHSSQSARDFRNQQISSHRNNS